jgi:DNA-binding transcriptional MerR regulator
MIGDFARRCRLPVSTLRYYDRIGLLRPIMVDPVNGYRRYTSDQLPAAALISHLRALGVPPTGISRIIAGGPTAADELARERRRIASEITLAQQRLGALDELLDAASQVRRTAEIVSFDAREVATLPFTLPLAQLETGVTRTIARLRTAVRHSGHHTAGPWGAAFPVDLDGEVTGFVFAPVSGCPRSGLSTTWLPATRAMATDHHGAGTSLSLAYHVAFAAIAELDATPSGLVLEEYLTADEPVPTPLTRVQIPFRDRANQA